MAEETFSDLGRVEAIAKLYEGTPYKPFESSWFETSGKAYVTQQSRTFIEGIDFDLVYFPLKHLGYKCVTAVTGELYVELSHPLCSKALFSLSRTWNPMNAAPRLSDTQIRSMLFAAERRFAVRSEVSPAAATLMARPLGEGTRSSDTFL